jgi:hypothetical protein
MAALWVRAPEQDTDIQTAVHRAVEHVEECAAGSWKAEVRREEGDRQPDAVARVFDRFSDPLECGDAIHERPHQVSRPDGVRARSHKWYVRLKANRV